MTQTASRTRPETGDRATEHGRTSIADAVVAKVAGLAARDVRGVYAMGGGMARAVGVVRERIPGSAAGPDVTQGVAVEVGDRQAAVDIDLVADHGVSIPDLADTVRSRVAQAVERTCGLETTEVNVTVGDVHLPGDD